MIKNYHVVVTIDTRTIEIRDQVETNYLEGEAYQIADLFYRAMLASGYSPAISANALVKAASNGGYVLMQPAEVAGQGDLYFEAPSF